VISCLLIYFFVLNQCIVTKDCLKYYMSNTDAS